MGDVRHHSSNWRLGIRLALALLPAGLVFGSVFAQQPAPQPAPAPGQTANMTGKGGFVDSADLRVSRIRFEAGARTYWHVHTTGQVIVAEEGQGLYQEQGSGIRKFVPGQAAYLKANVAHWHGAASDAPVVQATMYGGTLKWLDPVSDEEYSGKKKR
jgi:quercetin dioxygenase-like cupin family protein